MRNWRPPFVKIHGNLFIVQLFYKDLAKNRTTSYEKKVHEKLLKFKTQKKDSLYCKTGHKKLGNLF